MIDVPLSESDFTRIDAITRSSAAEFMHGSLAWRIYIAVILLVFIMELLIVCLMLLAVLLGLVK